MIDLFIWIQFCFKEFIYRPLFNSFQLETCDSYAFVVYSSTVYYDVDLMRIFQ